MTNRQWLAAVLVAVFSPIVLCGCDQAASRSGGFAPSSPKGTNQAGPEEPQLAGPETADARQPQDSDAAQGTSSSPGSSAAQPTPGKRPQNTQQPTAEPTVSMPKVLLTEAHQALCVVKVGDPMPEATLVDLDGKEHELGELFGETATVVFFWTGDSLMSRTGLADLGPDIAAPYSGQGVKVVGIAVGQTAESAGKELADVQTPFPHLLDSDGALFAKVGSEKLPRVYLVDAGGKVAWFDIEYSRSTRRDLAQAVRYLLQQSR